MDIKNLAFCTILLLLQLVINVLADQVICSADIGQLRLADGPSPNEGRLEMRNGCTWGTVCDDMFSLEDAAVACRRLGFPGVRNVFAVPGHSKAPSGSPYGPGPGPIYLDEVDCTGFENDLMECIFSYGSSDCTHAEDVGLICEPKTPTSTPSPSCTPSSTRTPSKPPTSSPSRTPSRTPTRTPSRTRSPTGTPMPTPSPSRTPSLSRTPSRTPSLSRTPSRTPSRTFAPSQTPTATRTPTRPPTAWT